MDVLEVSKNGKLIYLNKRVERLIATPVGYRLISRGALLESSGGRIHICNQDINTISEEIIFN